MARSTLLLFAALLLLLLGGGYWLVRTGTATRAEVHDRAIAELEQVPEAQVQPLLRQLVASTSEPEVLLSRCLCSSRVELIEATELELTELLATWRSMPRDQAALRLCLLIECLESSISHMSPTARPVARQMVEHALRWPLFPGSEQTPVLLATCQRSLAALDRLDSMQPEGQRQPIIRVAERDLREEVNQNHATPRMFPAPQTNESQPLR
jgi:hypothetical protein